MGAGASAKAADSRDAEVEEAMKTLQAVDNQEHKVLVLGGGESGKSTILKQLKMVFKVGFSHQEMSVFQSSLRQNVLDSAKVIVDQSMLDGFPRLNMDQSLQTALQTGKAELDGDTAAAISAAWYEDEAFQAIWAQRSKFWILDAAEYYFTEATRFAEDDFEPDEEDCIMARTRTTGMVLSDFHFQKHKYSIIDVGGQRSERRKWIHFFDNVQTIIFVVSLIEYNQVMFEDQNSNRLHDSLQLFAKIVSNPIFATTPFFLFLNKKDLFETMVKKQDLSVCFPEYTAGPNSLVASEFIKTKFCDIYKQFRADELRCHVLAASVRMDIKIGFKDVTTLLQRSK